jgi:hypothetical protein
MALLFLLALFAINALPPQPASLAVDPFELATRGVRMRFHPPIEEPKPWQPSAGVTTAAAPAPAPARHTSTPHRVRMAGENGQIRGARTSTAVRAEAEAAAAQAGALGTLSTIDGSHLGAVFGPGSAFGDARAAMGELGGSLTGDAAGEMAVDRVGARLGGHGETVGLGEIEGRHRPGSGSGYAGCTGLHGRRPTMIPAFTIPAPEVHGPIDKDLIRRAVRSQSQAFRFCYERELQHKPELSGRVVTRFTIASNGRIVAAMTESSTMNDAAVDACVADVFRRLEMPKMPPGMSGVAIVTYPLAFHSAAQGM